MDSHIYFCENIRLEQLEFRYFKILLSYMYTYVQDNDIFVTYHLGDTVL